MRTDFLLVGRNFCNLKLLARAEDVLVYFGMRGDIPPRSSPSSSGRDSVFLGGKSPDEIWRNWPKRNGGRLGF